MNRWGWILVLALFLGTGLYLFWPADQTEAGGRPVWQGEAPGAFRLSTPGLQQRLEADGSLTINGVARPPSHQALGSFAPRLRSLRAARILEEPRSADLAAHGLDGEGRSELRDPVGDLLLAWRRGEQGAVVHDPVGARLCFLGEAAARTLDRLGERLDRPELLPGLSAVTRLEAGGRSHLRRADGWCDAAAPERPALSGRVQRLLALLARVPLVEWSGTEPTTPPWQVLQAGDHTVRIHRDPPVLAIDTLPPQPLPAPELDRLAAALAALEQERLYGTPPAAQEVPVDLVVVRRGGEEWYRLLHGGPEALERGESWTLQLGERRLAADRLAGDRFVAAFLDLLITAPRLRSSVLERPPAVDDPATVTIELGGPGLEGPWWLQIHGREVGGPGHLATAVDLPPLLADPAPEQLLSPLLVGRPVARLGKLQRLRHEAEGVAGEILRRPAGGTWEALPVRGAERLGQPHPVDQHAVERLLRALAGARAERVALYDRERHAGLAIERSLTLRIDPIPPGEADAQVLEEDTLAQDRAWYLARHEGAWLAIDEIPERVYTLGDELVELLFAPVDERLVLPIVPWQVHELRFTPPSGAPYRLRRGAESWLVLQDGRVLPADAAAVDAWLLRIGRLVASDADADAVPLSSGAGELVVVLPQNATRDEELTLVLGSHVGALQELSVTSTRLLEPALPGRVRVPVAVVEWLLPPMAAFVDPARLREEPRP